MNRRLVLCIVPLLLAAACETGSPRERGGDYREDQATRMTTEDAQRNTRSKKRSLDTSKREGQNVIDQPR